MHILGCWDVLHLLNKCPVGGLMFGVIVTPL